MTLLAAAELVPADRAAVVLPDDMAARAERLGWRVGRPVGNRTRGIVVDGGRVNLGTRRRRAARCVLAGLPDELVGHRRSATGGTFRREEVADRDLQAGFLARGRRDGLEGRIEVPNVGRAKDDLGEQPGQRI